MHYTIDTYHCARSTAAALNDNLDAACCLFAAARPVEGPHSTYLVINRVLGVVIPGLVCYHSSLGLQVMLPLLAGNPLVHWVLLDIRCGCMRYARTVRDQRTVEDSQTRSIREHIVLLLLYYYYAAVY